MSRRAIAPAKAPGSNGAVAAAVAGFPRAKGLPSTGTLGEDGSVRVVQTDAAHHLRGTLAYEPAPYLRPGAWLLSAHLTMRAGLPGAYDVTVGRDEKPTAAKARAMGEKLVETMRVATRVESTPPRGAQMRLIPNPHDNPAKRTKVLAGQLDLLAQSARAVQSAVATHARAESPPPPRRRALAPAHVPSAVATPLTSKAAVAGEVIRRMQHEARALGLPLHAHASFDQEDPPTVVLTVTGIPWPRNATLHTPRVFTNEYIQRFRRTTGSTELRPEDMTADWRALVGNLKRSVSSSVKYGGRPVRVEVVPTKEALVARRGNELPLLVRHGIVTDSDQQQRDYLARQIADWAESVHLTDVPLPGRDVVAQVTPHGVRVTFRKFPRPPAKATKSLLNYDAIEALKAGKGLYGDISLFLSYPPRLALETIRDTLAKYRRADLDRLLDFDAVHRARSLSELITVTIDPAVLEAEAKRLKLPWRWAPR